MFGKLSVVFLIGLLNLQLSQAAYVTKCRSADANCIRMSSIAAMPAFAAGIPELNVAPMDPLYIESLDASSKDLKLVFKDMFITGFKNCDIQRMQRDVANSKLLSSVFCDSLDVKGHYEMDGSVPVLPLPLQGKGDAHVQLNKILFEVEGNMGEKIDKQGVKHWDIKSFTPSFDLKDNAKLHLDNLFNGNKELAAPVYNLFESNPNGVLKAIGVPIVQGIVSEVVGNVNNFFHGLPAEELSID